MGAKSRHAREVRGRYRKSAAPAARVEKVAVPTSVGQEPGHKNRFEATGLTSEEEYVAALRAGQPKWGFADRNAFRSYIVNKVGRRFEKATEKMTTGYGDDVIRYLQKRKMARQDKDSGRWFVN